MSRASKLRSRAESWVDPEGAGGYTPEGTRWALIGVAVIAAGVLGFSALSGGRAPVETGTVTATAGRPDLTVPADVTAPPSTATGAVPDETVPAEDGYPEEVDAEFAEAAVVAERWAEGLFTGDFGGVRTSDGSPLPVVASPWPAPTVADPELVGIGDGRDEARFAVIVDPDGDGSEPAQTVRVIVDRFSASDWRVAPL